MKPHFPEKESFSFCKSWTSCRSDFVNILPRLLTEPLESFQGELIWSTTYKKSFRIAGEKLSFPGDFVIKYYREKRFFRYLFRPSMALREYRGFVLTEKAGIPVAEVLAFGEKRCFLRLKEAFFVTKYLDNTHSGDEFLSAGCDVEQKDTYIKLNMEYLAKFHNAGLIHGGFNPRNELWRIKTDGTMEVIWIDLATCRKKTPREKRTQESDLYTFFKHFNFPETEEKAYRDYYWSFRKKMEF